MKHFIQETVMLCVVMLFLPQNNLAQYSLTPSAFYAVKNRELHLTCNIGPSSSVPSFAIAWKQNGHTVAFIQSSNCQTHVGTGGQDLYQRYTYNCTSNRSYNIYISSTQINSEDGSVWSCGDNDPRLGSSSDYTLIVYDPPTADPVISGYSGTTTYLGNTITLTCTLDGGNPLANLTWTCKGINVQGDNANTQTSAISRYMVTIDTSYNGETCTCTASHQLWSDNKQVHSQSFVVHFPPTTNPIVSGYEGTFRYQDDIVTLTCTVSGGSPPPTLSWTCNGQQQSDIRQSTSGTTVTSDISVTMNKELNRKTCICQGRHSDTRYSPNVSSYPFIVYYPPSNPLVEVSPDTPFPWIEKGNGKLRCSVNDGNPPVSYEWSSPAGVISGQTSHILSLTSLTKDYNRKGYKCKVSNAYTIANKLNLLSRTKELDVEYNPVVTVGISPTYIRETETFERLCTADGNPPPTVSWTSNTSPSNAAILKLVNTIRNKTGDYTCRALAQSRGLHGLLSGQAVLKVIVQFPPTVQAILEQTSITEGQTVFMYCLATGVPDQYTYGGWVQEYRNTIIRSSNDFMLSQNKQNLTLSGVTHQDIGTYRCKAHNTIKDKNENLYQHGTTNLDIKFSAVFNSSRKYHTELNKTFEIRIPFFLNHVLQNVNTITLTKQNKNQKERSDIKMNIGTTNIDIVFYGKTIAVEGQEVIIQMIQFKSEQQGNYTIGIKNYDEGSISYFVFEVILSGPPEHPKDFKILSSTTDSVEVTWLAGNNGGHPQTFVISYQQKGKDETLKTKNVTETLNKINYTLIISGLTSETEYSFSIYAYNSRGNSKRNLESLTSYPIATAKLKSNEGNTTGTIIGIVVPLSIILVVACIIGFILLKKRRSSNRTNRKDGVLVNGHSNASTNNDIVEDEEDGMRINILYESAGANFKKPGTTIGTAYSDETRGKSGVDNPAALYAEVQKKKPPVDPSALYAEVQKPYKTPKGMLYENVENVRKDKNVDVNMYPSADEVPGTSSGAIPKTKQSKPKKSVKKNKDGLIYADLELEFPSQTSDKKPVIHGSENRTDYAEVDFSRRAAPLPPQTDEVQNERQETQQP